MIMPKSRGDVAVPNSGENEEELSVAVPGDDVQVLRDLIPHAFSNEEGGTETSQVESGPSNLVDLDSEEDEEDEAGAEDNTSTGSANDVARPTAASLSAEAPNSFDMIDDPVRMYLREIGQVSLLKAKDERRLARAAESGNYVEQLEQELISPTGVPPNMKSPYGMKWEDNRLVPDENYAVASEILHMVLAGQKIRSVARELTWRGIPTPSGRLGWRPSSIVYILKNRTYSGVIETLKTEAVEPTRRRTGSYGKTGSRARPQNERIRLQGMVESPIVTEDEFEWIQERLKENQRLAQKNTKLRQYLLKGRIRCATCGRAYIGVTRNSHSQYYCGGRWQPGPLGDRCQSPRFEAVMLEGAVYGMVQEFLQGQSGFEAEIQRRHGMSAESATNVQQELRSLEQQKKREQNAEAKAFRLAAHGDVSEEVFGQELGLIRTRQRWIAEQMNRLEQQLATIQSYSYDPESVEALRERLESRLEAATPEDQRFILEAVGTTVVAHTDGTWELELQVPQEAPEPVQIVNSTPGFHAGGIGGVPLSPNITGWSGWERIRLA